MSHILMSPWLWLVMVVICVGAIIVLRLRSKKKTSQSAYMRNLQFGYEKNKGYMQRCERALDNFASKLHVFERQVALLARDYPDKAALYRPIMGNLREVLKKYKETLLEARAATVNQEAIIALLKGLEEAQSAMREAVEASVALGNF